MSDYDNVRTETDDGDLRHTGTKDPHFRHVQHKTTDTDELSVTNVGVAAYATSNQTVSDVTVTKVALDSIEFEDGPVTDADLTNNKVVIQEPGVYLIVGQIRWASDAGWTTGDNANLDIHVNGARVGQGTASKAGTTAEAIHRSYVNNLSSGDEVDMRAYQTSGASKTLTGAQDRIRLQVVKIA